MNTEAWRREISEAATQAAVIGVVKRFVDALDQVEINELPVQCRPTRIGTAQDIAHWAFTLAKASLSSEEDQGVLREVSLVFAEGSSRIAQLALGRSVRTISHPVLGK